MRRFKISSGTPGGVRTKTGSYLSGKLLVKLLFGCVTRVHVLGCEHADCPAGFLLAANHISHFDPFLISLAVRRNIDWMTMAEFFRSPLLRFLLHAVNAFPAERDRADRKTVRTAIDRLKSGRVVGLFPEGGIRDGVHSLLEGASLRRGVSAVAQIAGGSIVPCVILGSDRLYSLKQWLPLRRTPIWIAFGEPISAFRELEKSEARRRTECELAAAFKNLYAQLRDHFSLAADDLPHSPRKRMKPRRHPERGRGNRLQQLTVAARDSSTSLRSARNDGIRHAMAITFDSLLSTSINLLHLRHRLNGSSRERMECYIAECERLTPQEYYAAPNGDAELCGRFTKVIENRGATIEWRSPIDTAFEENNFARAEFFQCAEGTSAPTVFLLHALMSASPIGYRRYARRFNQLGWNACFVHLPYHFSRVPRGYLNGELAITCDLIRNAEGLRQGVTEVRQLINAMRQSGCREFGVLGTSYGGWIGALLATVECDFRFVALMAPIVNLEHAIWSSRAARIIRRELRGANIKPSLVARHFHLSSPLHCQATCEPARVLLVTGEFDSIAPPTQIEAIHRKWGGSELLRVRQGHFGYRMMRETIERLKQRGDL